MPSRPLRPAIIVYQFKVDIPILIIKVVPPFEDKYLVPGRVQCLKLYPCFLIFFFTRLVIDKYLAVWVIRPIIVLCGKGEGDQWSTPNKRLTSTATTILTALPVYRLRFCSFPFFLLSIHKRNTNTTLGLTPRPAL